MNRVKAICALLIAACGFGVFGAAVPTPTVMWDKDFGSSSLTKGGYTITVGDNNSVASDNSSITIGDESTVGVKVSGGAIYTVVVKASAYTPAAASDANPEVIAAMLYNNNCYVGLGAKSDKKGWYIWNNSAWGSTHVTSSAVINDTESHKYVVSYIYTAASQVAQGTTIRMDDSQLCAETGLRGSDLANATSITIGGPQGTGSSLAVAKGLKIEGIAIFGDTSVSAVSAAAYKFPSEYPTESNYIKKNVTWGNVGNATDGGVATASNKSRYTGDKTFIWNFGSTANVAPSVITNSGKVAIKKIRFGARDDSTLDATLVPTGLTLTQGSYSASAGAPTTSGTITVYKADKSVQATRTCFEFTFEHPVIVDAAKNFTVVAKQGSSGKIGFGVIQPASGWTPMFEIVGDYTPRRSLSINFGSGSGSVSGTYGIFPSASWNNTNDGTSSSGTEMTVSDGSKVTVKWWSSGNWSYTTMTDNALKGYLDDGGCGDGTGGGPRIKIENVPFDFYNIIIYHASDTEGYSFNPPAIGAIGSSVVTTAYSYDGSTNATRNTTSLKFGQTRYAVATVGKNVSYLKMPFSYPSLDIKGGNNTNSARGGIAAIQIVEAFPSDYAATVYDETATWSTQAGLEQTAGSLAEDESSNAISLSNTSVDSATVNFDVLPTVASQLSLTSASGKSTTFTGMANTQFAAYDFSQATGDVCFDATAGYTPDAALKNYIRKNNVKVTFNGSGDNGVTLDYGSAEADRINESPWISGHIVFDNGTHVFKGTSENAGQKFGANATADNPTLYAKNKAVLNWYSRNPCGWSLTANDEGIARIASGSKIKLLTSESGTWYWAQQFYLDAGSELEIATEADKMSLQGGINSDKPQILMPDSSGTATISASGTGQLRLAKDQAGAVAKVGKGSTLVVTAPLVSQNSSAKLDKYGTGTLRFTGSLSGFGAPLEVQEGTVEIVSTSSFGDGATIPVASGATLKFGAADSTIAAVISGNGSVTKDGADTKTVLTGSNSYTGGTTVSGGTLVVNTPNGTYTIGGGTLDLRGNRSANIASIAEGGKLAFKQAATGEDATITATVTGLADGDYKDRIAVLTASDDAVEVPIKSATVASGTLTIELSNVTFSADVASDTSISAIETSVMGEGKTFEEAAELTLNCTGNPTITIDKSLHITKLVISGAATLKFDSGCILTVPTISAADTVTLDCSLLAAGEVNFLVGTIDATKFTTTGVTDKHSVVITSTGVTAYIKESLSRNNPVTGDAQTFTFAFLGYTSADWDNTANWRTNDTSVLMPYADSNYPQKASSGEYAPIVFDGDLIPVANRTISMTTTMEGWNTRIACLNGVNVGATFTKIQGNDGSVWFWVDSESSLRILSGVGDRASDENVSVYVANENGLSFEQSWGNSHTFNYYLKGYGSVRFEDTLTAGTHAIKQIELQVGETKDARHVAKQKLVSFVSSSSTPTFTWSDVTASCENGGATASKKDAMVNVSQDVGSFFIQQESDGVYAYVVVYADTWDLVEPLTATLTADTDWTSLPWKDYYNHDFTNPSGVHTYKVVAGDYRATLSTALETGSTLEITSGALAFDVAAEASLTFPTVISGAGKVVKTGAGDLILTGVNTYTGGTVVEAGTAKYGFSASGSNPGPFGNYANNTTDWTTNIVVRNGATLEQNGKYDATYVVELQQGATFRNTVSYIPDNNRQTKRISLSGDATVNATCSFGLHNGGNAATYLDLGSCTLTKTGAGDFDLVNTTVTGSGTIDVTAGKLHVSVSGNTSAPDATISVGSAGTLTVDSGRTLSLGKLTAASGATITNNGTINGLKELTDIDLTAISGTVGFSSDVTLHGTVKAGTGGFGTSTVTLGDGVTLDIGDACACGSLNVTGNAKINLRNTTGAFGAAITVAAGKILTIDGAAADTVLTLTSTITGDGNVVIGSNIAKVAVGSVRDFSSLGNISVGSGKVVVTATREEMGKGAVSISNVPSSGVTSIWADFDGTLKEMTVEDGAATVSNDVMIGGKATIFDVTFANNKSDIGISGSSGGTFTYKAYDSAVLKYDNAATFTMTADDTWDDTVGCYIRCHPYIDSAAGAFASLSDFSAVIVGQMSPTKKTQFIHIGSSDPNYGRTGVLIATTDTDNQVMITVNKDSVVDTANAVYASVPNASTVRHAYVITKTGNVMKVYVDGTLRGQITLADGFTLGTSSHSGIQVGSDFGGKITAAGTWKAVQNVDTETGYVNVIRVYDYVLSSEQANKVAEVYGATDDSDVYTRTIEGDANLSSSDAWKLDVTGTTADLPQASTEGKAPSATISVNGEATLTLNAGLALNTLTINESEHTLAFAGANKLTVADKAVINAPIKVAYNSLVLAGTPIQLGTAGAIEFDVSAISIAEVYEHTTYQLTGLMDETTAVTIKDGTIPTAKGRTAALAYSNGAYVLEVNVDHAKGSEVQYVSGYWSDAADNTIAVQYNGETSAVFPGDTVVIGSAATVDKAWVAATLPTNVSAIRIDKDFTFSAGVDEAILGSTTITVPAGKTLSFVSATKTDGVTLRVTNVGAITFRGGGTVSIGSNCTMTGAVFATDDTAWTGTVRLPSMWAEGLDLNAYGNANSTIDLLGITGGYLSVPEAEITINPTLKLTGAFMLTSTSPRAYAFARVTGSGNMTFSTTGDEPSSLAITTLTNYTGGIANNFTNTTLAVGTLYVAETPTAKTKLLAKTTGSAVSVASVLNANGESIFSDSLICKTESNGVYAVPYSADAPITPASDDGEVVVPVMPSAGITIEPGVNLKVPAATSADKITVKYGDTVLKGGTGTQYVEASVDADTGAVTLSPTDAAKPTPTAMTGTTTESSDTVSITIGTPVPGLFYEILTSTDGTNFKSSTAEGDGATQATSTATHTVSVTPPTDSEGKTPKVTYYRLAVKATK